MPEQRKTKKKRDKYTKKIRNIVITLIAVLIMLKINKTIFFLVVFIQSIIGETNH